MPYSKETHRSVSTWFPLEVLASLDRHLAARCPLPGQRVSRQDWLIDVVRRELAAAESEAVTQPQVRP